MKGITFEMSDYDELKIFGTLMVYIIHQIEIFLADNNKVVQARLLLSIVQKMYIKKLVQKLALEPNKYNVKITHIECLTLWMAITNQDLISGTGGKVLTILVRLTEDLDRYVINLPNKKLEQCVLLLE